MDSSSDDPNPILRNTKPKASQLASSSSFTSPVRNESSLPAQSRNNPYLPTPTEIFLLALYPFLLLLGTLYAVLSPTVRAAPYDHATQSHIQDPSLAPSYFARKNNLFNVLFVKRGWAWITFSFFLFLFTHPAMRSTNIRIKAGIRWGVVTAWWVFVTQWFFGPAIIDRGFRISGGGCEDKLPDADDELGDKVKGLVSAAACKAAGGRWSGGHDISGHVFLLVLGSAFLLQEVGWVCARWARYLREERTVVMIDGAVKGAGLEKGKREREEGRTFVIEEETVARTAGDALGYGGKVAAGVYLASVWMLLMTAIYFHTWFEKLTGLLVALAGLYATYVLPRFIPAIRSIIGEIMPRAKISVPSNLPELVKNAFNRARASGDVNFYPTQVKLLNINSIPFQLRFAPSLLSKPKSPLPPPPSTDPDAVPPQSQEQKKSFFDPFDNPAKAMLITPLGEGHNLVLNKFAIVPEHFILTTKEWKEQEDLLEAQDLEAAYACIKAFEEHDDGKGGGKELYVFFNSGKGSGASQPHRHLQMLVVDRMREGLPPDTQWDVLTKRLGEEEDPEKVRDKLPFKVFLKKIKKGEEDDLRGVYIGLYREGCKSLGVELGEEEEELVERKAKISYNLGMTRDVMVLMPRVEEGGEVEDDKGEVVGQLALNGTVLAGTALVKSQREWEALSKGDEAGERQVRDVLGRIGVPTVPVVQKWCTSGAGKLLS
ncbi:inositol phospholipid synthesis protein Scs3p [Cladorrhinum sp. PSN259]|nr:inositol phospholipid synthesis protein Scs3p [Cladorrhinum sp. PSN259]